MWGGLPWGGAAWGGSGAEPLVVGLLIWVESSRGLTWTEFKRPILWAEQAR